MAKGSAKGSAFERKICKKLSLWWTDDERDDIFWRTSGSGARATGRAKQGKSTFGQYGDIQATDPVGQPLLDVCSIEMKVGYGKYSLLDILDGSGKRENYQYIQFLEQSLEDAEKAEVRWNFLITKRDRGKEIICFPKSFYQTYQEKCPALSKVNEIEFALCFKYKDKHFYLMTLDDFLEWVPARYFNKKWYAKERGQRRKN